MKRHLRHKEKTRLHNEANPVDAENTTRKCSGPCKSEKTLSNFPKDKSQKLGYAYKCKSCKLEAQAQRANEKNDLNIDPYGVTKKCQTKNEEDCCGQVKKLIYFTKQSTGLYGYANLCIDCRMKQRRKHVIIEKADITEKYCSGCKKTHNIDEFSDDKYSKDGYQVACKKHQLKKTAVTQSKFGSFLKRILNDAKQRSVKKSIQFEITLEYITQLYNQQNGLCALTGVKMTHNAINDRQEDDPHILNPTNISIDRIDSNSGYVKGNLQLVCAIVNRIKFEMNDVQLFKFCCAVITTNKFKIILELDKHFGYKYETPKLSENEIKFIDYKYTNTIHNAKKRNLDVKITRDDIINQYNKQKGRCNLTNVKLTFDKQSNSDLSIDRIDSSKGYTMNNIQLISNTANKSKSDINDSMFFEWITKIRLFYLNFCDDKN